MTVADRTSEERRGFRPGSRRRARIAGGVALAAAAVGGNVLVYSNLDDRADVVQLVTDVRAGEVLTADALRVVEADLDPTVPVVTADQMSSVVGQYARVHLVSGSLLSPVVLQGTPLVAEGRSVVALELRPTRVPTGLRERSHVDLIVLADDGSVVHTPGRVVTRPDTADGITGVTTMSVEVDAAAAGALAVADDVRVVLLDPAGDAVYGGAD